MRKLLWAAAWGAALTGPATAQSLNDVGRSLQQLLPGQQQPNQGQQDRERAIYEQGRRDQEQANREERRRRDEARGRDARPYDDRRPDDRRSSDDRRRYDNGRGYDNADRPYQQQPGRY